MITRLLRTNLLLIAGLALLLSACGAAATPGTGAAPNPTSAATPNAQPIASAKPAEAPSSGASGSACTILDKAAVSQATGFAVTQTNGTDAICYYQSADQSHYLVVTLYGNPADMATVLQIEPSGEHVADLGDDAFWVPSAGILFVRKGDHAIELLDPDAGNAANGAASRDAFVALVRGALSSV